MIMEVRRFGTYDYFCVFVGQPLGSIFLVNLLLRTLLFLILLQVGQYLQQNVEKLLNRLAEVQH